MLVTTKVRCCVCLGTGKAPRLIFWQRDCRVCGGAGQRDVIYDDTFPEAVKRMVLQDAEYGINQLARRG